jgi:hypothetical protein
MERRLVLCPVVLLLMLNASAKDKNKGILSAEVLRAQTVTVLIDPEAGEPLTDPSANRRAQEDVENALSKWGRFRIVLEARTADLVITVRKGTPRGATPTIRGGAIDDRPVIVQSGGSGDIRIGAQGGPPPSATEPGIGMPQDSGPRLGTEVGPSEDTMQVYRGGVQYPLDSAPVWRYAAKNALRAPVVPAVEQFKKAITESEKALAQKQGKRKP